MTDEIDAKVKQLVIARLRSTPPNMGILIGANAKELSPVDIIHEVESESELGKEYIEMDMEFLRALQKGLIFG